METGGRDCDVEGPRERERDKSVGCVAVCCSVLQCDVVEKYPQRDTNKECVPLQRT